MIGVIAAISASFFWTLACFIWRSQTKYLPAIEINVIKNIIAALIFLPLIFTFNWFANIYLVSILLLS